jgi:hypothetical protein
MAQHSDVILDIVDTLVWLLVLMLSLVIVALQCPLPRQFVSVFYRLPTERYTQGGKFR